ncbi:MAG: hypothetical protein M1828_002897 [Chrysothrix sp. TS-e1954]|nr:MAG: hypothetical protein M1828_002897 [Chrysothrix sp. TS-e1954]
MRSKNLPRIICYQQTHFYNDQYISLLPIITENTAVTHIILAAIHLNDNPGDITLNDDPYDASKNEVLWAEVSVLQESGIKVLGMLGGTAKGTFTRLDTEDDARFNAFYEPLRHMILTTGIDGIDLNVVEDMSLGGIIHLIDQMRRDFGGDFIITVAPVAPALQGKKHLSGFDYALLEDIFGDNIAWYNAQFYCNWESAETTKGYDEIIARGWNPEKVVMGLMTSPQSGAGWLPDEIVRNTLITLTQRYPRFGGVMGWEYFGSVTTADPSSGFHWSWANLMTTTLGWSQRVLPFETKSTA